MNVEPHISLDCPHCHEAICAAISWFKKCYSTCPHCEQGLAGSQFANVIVDLEQAMDECVEEMINSLPGGGCCGSKGECGG